MPRSDKAAEKPAKLGKVREKHPDSFGARFGKLIYRCRVEQRLSQSELAIRLWEDEARKSDVADLENGYIRKPHAKTINLYADTLDIPQEDIDACHTPTEGAYTRAEHEDRLEQKEAQLRQELERAGADRGRLEARISEVRRRLSDSEADFQRVLAELEETRAALDRHHNTIDREKIDAAKRALDRGDLTLANALFEESKAALLAQAHDTHREAAKLAFRQAEIANQDIRWQDAETLYTQAATLAATDIRYWIECSRARKRLGLFPAAQAAIRTAQTLADAQNDERHVEVTGNDLGDLLVIEGRHEEAAALFEAGLLTARARSEKSGTPDALRDLSVSLERVGDAARTRGDHEAAAAAYDESLTVRRQLNDQLGTPDALRDLSVSLNKVGDAARTRGDHEAAAAAYDESLTVARQLNDQLGTPDALRDLAVSLYNMTVISLRAHDLPAARAFYAEAQALIPTLHPLHIEEIRAAFAPLAPFLED